MRLNNTFFGYKIVDGRAVIHEKDAGKVRLLYKGYLSGLSYIDAAKAVGLDLHASSVKMLMRNARYTGDDFYPEIIDPEMIFTLRSLIAPPLMRLKGNDYADALFSGRRKGRAKNKYRELHHSTFPSDSV